MRYGGVRLKWLMCGLLPLVLLCQAGGALAQNFSDPGALAYIQADKLQALGLTGKGIKVGVISDGVQGLAALQSRGVLPTPIGLASSPSEPNAVGNGGEGEALLQVVHQIAPDALLYFCTNVIATLGISSCAQDLIAQFGVNIVVDDMSQEPSLYLSPDAANYDNILTAHPGVIAIHAGGNDATGIFVGDFRPISLAIGGQTYPVEDFGAASGKPRDPYETVTLVPGSYVFDLSWSDDPTVQPLTPASRDANAFGLWLIDAESGAVVASERGLPTQPQAQVVYTTQSTEKVEVVVGLIQKVSDAPVVLALDGGEVNEGRNGLVRFPYVTPGQAGGDLAGASRLLTVGASTSMATVAFGDMGITPGTVDGYSDTGPSTYYWSAVQNGTDSLGVPILVFSPANPPIVNEQPALTGGSCWNIVPDPTYFNYPIFCGTSSAAPSVAGVAALLMQAGLTRDQIMTALEQTAKPLTTDPYGNPIVQTQGTWNQMDGYGLVQGYAALKYAGVAIPQPAITTPSGSTSVTVGQRVNFSGNCTVTGGLTISSYSWDFGNGQTSTDQNPTGITFAAPGTYTVSFNCADSNGLSSGSPATIVLTAAVSSTGGGSGGGSSGGGSSGGGGGGIGLFALLTLILLNLRHGRRELTQV